MHLARTLLLVLVIALSASRLFAAGYDKGTMFSGRYSGVASAATASVAGSESVFFNPAGLSRGAGSEASINLSPTFSQFQGVVIQGGSNVKSKTDMAPIFAVFGGHQLTDAFSVGLGVYAAGGTAAEYESVDLTSMHSTFSIFKPTVKSSLSLIEFSPAIAYSVSPNFRLGFAWRILAAKGEFSSVSFVSTGVGAAPYIAVASQVKDLSQTRYDGFRLGAQWSSDDQHTGFGASWRTSVKLDLTGTSTVQSQFSSTTAKVIEGTGGPTTVSTTFPSQINVGGYHDFESINTRLLLDYSWTNYSVNRELAVAGNVTFATTSAASTTTAAAENVPFNWKNQHLIKLGAETADWQDWALRGGVAYVTQVVPNDRAGATLVAPGGGFSVHGGVGKYLADKSIEVNGSLEYDLVKGSGSSPNTKNAAAGEYTTSVIAIHTGLTWHL